MCMKLYTLFRSLFVSYNVREFLVQDVLYLQEEDLAIEFWRLKGDLRNECEYLNTVMMMRGRARWKEAWETRFQHCTDPSGQILYLFTLHGHSGRKPIDQSLQDNVVIQSGFFQHIFHIGTVFCTAVNPTDKDHKDPQELDFTKPRLA